MWVQGLCCSQACPLCVRIDGVRSVHAVQTLPAVWGDERKSTHTGSGRAENQREALVINLGLCVHA